MRLGLLFTNEQGKKLVEQYRAATFLFDCFRSRFERMGTQNLQTKSRFSRKRMLGSKPDLKQSVRFVLLFVLLRSKPLLQKVLSEKTTNSNCNGAGHGHNGARGELVGGGASWGMKKCVFLTSVRTDRLQTKGFSLGRARSALATWRNRC